MSGHGVKRAGGRRRAGFARVAACLTAGGCGILPRRRHPALFTPWPDRKTPLVTNTIFFSLTIDCISRLYYNIKSILRTFVRRAELRPAGAVCYM